MGELLRLEVCILVGVGLLIPAAYFIAPLFSDPSVRQIVMFLLAIFLGAVSIALWNLWRIQQKD